MAATPVYPGRGDAEQGPDPVLQETLRAGTRGLDPSDVLTVRAVGSAESE